MFERRTIAVCSGKGGVGKSSICSAFSTSLARSSRRVLVVDLDPDSNIGKDLGYSVWGRPTRAHVALGLADTIGRLQDDDGRALADALAAQDPSRLLVLRDVRPGLDVLPGGSFLEDLTELPEAFWLRRGQSRRSVLRDLLDKFAAPYDLVVIDTGPGHIALQEMAVVAAQFVVLATRSDEGSIGALAKIAKVFERVFDDAPDVELLGVVLFGVNPSATRVQHDTRVKISSVLGQVAPVFNSTIRYLEAAAADCRSLGVVPFELAAFTSQLPRFVDKGYQKESWSRSSPQLADDFERLALEIAMAHRSRVLDMEDSGRGVSA